MTILNRNRSDLSCGTVFCFFMFIFLIMLQTADGVLAATTERVSLDSDGLQANGASWCFYYGSSFISADGRHIVFESDASNLVPDDTNAARDIFVHDRTTGQTSRVSLNSDGNQGNRSSYDPSLSADGRYIAFESDASNLVPDDTNVARDIFVYDRTTSETTRVSLDSSGGQGNGGSYRSAISADGLYVAFDSYSTNLVAGDTNGVLDVFVHDRTTGETTRVSIDSGGAQDHDESVAPSISANGRYIAFDSYSTNLVAGDTNGVLDVFVHDRTTGHTSRVSLDSNGLQGNGDSASPFISTDGRYVVFEADASNLVPDDTNGAGDVFVHDRTTGETTRVSLDSNGLEGNGDSASPSISANGRYVAFSSNATNLVDEDTSGVRDIFVHDRTTGLTVRLSLDSDGIEGNGVSYIPSISATGRYVAFGSGATNLVDDDTNEASDIFVSDTGEKDVDTDPGTGWSSGGCFIGSLLD